MKLIGLMLNLAVITGFVYGNHHKTDTETVNEGEVDGLTLIPSDPTMVRYTNESLIVLCRSPTPEVKLHWKSPKGEIIEEHKGRIHIEPTSQPEELKLVFTHISLADKGNWECEDTTGAKAKKVFDLIVFQKITFTENTTMLTVKEGQNATILCEVKGEPQPNITWHFNGQPIEVNSTKFRVLGDGLLINSVIQNDTGEYTCRAYQVNPIASDMQERTVLMKIEHKPIWTHQNDKKEHYTYLNGTTILKCEAVAEPPGNFTWYHNKKQIHNDKHFTIKNDNYISMLDIKASDESVFSIYKCKVKNHLGSIERSIVLKRGIKPPTPHPIKLRGLNSHTFDIELSVTRPNNTKPQMEVNGYRIEYMSEMEFKKDLGKWTNAKRRDFNYESGATFLLNNLEANTSYLVRAASRNVAGLSEWTKVEKFTTQNIPQTSASTKVVAFTHILCFTLVALILSQDLTFALPNSFVINLAPLLDGTLNRQHL